jgi:hypothetical protein
LPRVLLEGECGCGCSVGFGVEFAVRRGTEHCKMGRPDTVRWWEYGSPCVRLCTSTAELTLSLVQVQQSVHDYRERWVSSAVSSSPPRPFIQLLVRLHRPLTRHPP